MISLLLMADAKCRSFFCIPPGTHIASIWHRTLGAQTPILRPHLHATLKSQRNLATTRNHLPRIRRRCEAHLTVSENKKNLQRQVTFQSQTPLLPLFGWQFGNAEAGARGINLNRLSGCGESSKRIFILKTIIRMLKYLCT